MGGFTRWRWVAIVAPVLLTVAGVTVVRTTTAQAGTASGATTAPATTAPATTAPAATAGRATRVYPLPDGDHVQVLGTGGSARVRFVPAPGHAGATVTSRVGGRLTVVPVTAFVHLSALDAYRVGAAAPAVVTPKYAMAPLQITAVDHQGRAVQAAEVIVVNVDDPTKANWDGLMTGGESRIEVPAGHYSVAVAAFVTDAKGNPTETDLLSVTDVTVPAAGTAVALDGRTAKQVSFSTPRPSTFSAAAVGWIRGTAGHFDVLNIGALAGTRLYVGAAAKAKYGVLKYSVVGRQLGPSYSYLLAIPKTDQIPANQTYPVAESGLATVDSGYVTDQPSQDLDIFDDWRLASDGPDDPVLPNLPDVLVHAPSTDRRYISASADLIYDGLMSPLPDLLDGQLERTLRFKPGKQVSLTWRGGLIAPAPATYDGPCFLCREGNTLHGIDAMDTDIAGDNGQWSDGPTTITQDGKTVYTGDTLGVIFDQKLPAAKHRYVYSIDTTHEPSTTALSTHSRISWGFDSAQVTKSTVPASWGCTPCAPVPILFARAEFAANAHASVAPGTATVDVSFLHQAYAADPAVRSAAISVSYDDGATWQPTTVMLTDAHHARGTWTVPAATKPGYLALKLHGVDAAGSTVDETVNHAALVNAPKGIALPPAGGSEPAPDSARAVCPTARPGYARCLALVAGRHPAATAAVAGRHPAATAAALPDGLARADLLSAYKLPANGGAGRTVAIVDAHDDPTAEADLAVYRKTYGLPPCTTQNGCFKKVNQNGKTSPLPAFDPEDDWSVEVSLDLDMVSAVCPDCHILLVESDSAEISSMGTAERAATNSGAVAVSNSWGGDETSDTVPWTAAFKHPGVAVTASSGDAGFQQASWPASLANVIAVGGTTLTSATNARKWTETAWKGAGSGCSAYTAKPAWQHDAHCPMRTSADVAAVADPKTGVAVYVQGDWAVVGGTSASSPIVAAMVALAGNSSQLTSAKYIYSHASKLFDVTSGSNANWNCGGDYLCKARKGYDGPTGMGTPNGLGAL